MLYMNDLAMPDFLIIGPVVDEPSSNSARYTRASPSVNPAEWSVSGFITY